MIPRFRTLLTIAALVPILNTVCQAQSLLATHHVRDVVLNGRAQTVGRLPATQSMRLVLVLPHRNEAGLQSFLQELYDPSSPSHRQFLTVEEFTERFGPSQEDYDAVIRFAESHGLTVVGTSRNRMNVDVEGPVARIEEALHVTMGVYRHPTENRTFYGPDREPTPSLPVALHHIAGLDDYSIPKPAIVHRPSFVQPQAASATGTCPSGSFCGSDMRAAYYGGTALTGSGQSVGLMEYWGTNLTDLATYFANAGQTNNVPVTLVSTDGTSTSCVFSSGCDDTEQTLDMTQAISMAPGLASLVMYVGATDSAIFNAMATAKPLNAQLSSSWTWAPADPSTDNPYLEEFAAQGQNLFQAAGDAGAWSSSHFEDYPADDVYLTSVGGTDLETNGAGGPWAAETAWSNAGGGPSPDKFAIPSWQTAAANTCASCSKTTRNGADVSANADYTFYVCADQSGCTASYYGGTSFAAPMWAGYLALANQQAVANTGSPLGFINPTLYTIAAGSSYNTNFHDITSGNNGYAATTGYDLASGLGSPNGASLINALVGSSQPPSLTPTVTSINPPSGAQGASVPVTLTGTNFVSGATTLLISGSGVTAINPSVVSGTQLTATFNIASGAALGGYSVSVSTANGTSGSVTFTVTQPPSLTPTVTSISPSSGVPGAGVPITLTGTNFVSGATTLLISGSGVTAINPSVVSGTQLTATFNIASGATLGGYSVSVSTANGTSGSVTFTVAQPTPTLTSISPSSASLSTNTPVTLTGTNFVSPATLNIAPSGVTASAVTVVSSTQITANFSVASSATTGAHNVSVSMSNGTTGAVSFTVNGTAGGGGSPTLSSISPSVGKAGTTVKVTLTGKNLTGLASIPFQITGGGITVTSITPVGTSGTALTANFVIAPNATKSVRFVSVKNAAGGASNTVIFTVD
jgi:subtilase family serine protease